MSVRVMFTPVTADLTGLPLSAAVTYYHNKAALFVSTVHTHELALKYASTTFLFSHKLLISAKGKLIGLMDIHIYKLSFKNATWKDIPHYQ